MKCESGTDSYQYQVLFYSNSALCSILYSGTHREGCDLHFVLQSSQDSWKPLTLNRGIKGKAGFATNILQILRGFLIWPGVT